jgi:hypothetical protein
MCSLLIYMRVAHQRSSLLKGFENSGLFYDYLGINLVAVRRFCIQLLKGDKELSALTGYVRICCKPSIESWLELDRSLLDASR